MTYNFEQTVNRLLSDRGQSRKSLYEHLALTRQGFEKKLKNNTVSVNELTEMADFFNLDATKLLELATKDWGKLTDEERKEYLQEAKVGRLALPEKVVEGIDEIRLFFEEELKAKNQQIAGLQRMLESVLGKPEGAIFQPLCTQAERFERIYQDYIMEVHLQLGTPHIAMPKGLMANVVAPR